MRQEGVDVKVHADHFPPDAPDEAWLEFAGREGLIVLTRDKGIRKRVLEVEAFRRHRVRAVVLIGRGAQGLTNEENLRAIRTALPAIQREVLARDAPCIFRLRANGALQEQELR